MKIPRRYWVSRWEGSYKDYTKNCDGCEWYRKIDDKELCGWGKAFKYLVRTEKRRQCQIIDRKQEFIPSAKYLDELVRENCI